MKTLTSLITISILLFLSGCSDSSNPLSSINTSGKMETGSSAYNGAEKTLLWKNNGISVKADGEYLVYEDLFCNIDHQVRTNLRVTFNGWTDADTTSYISTLVIENNGETIFLENGGQYINRYHDLYFENINQGSLRFYISLWCDDVQCNSTASLQMTQISVSRY